MFNLHEFAREVHQNAREHGWWEKPRKDAEIRALIHSEWSEALEEARAGRPMVWHMCMDPVDSDICEEQKDCPCKLDMWETDCAAYRDKPEGVAVELIDGCIRILDYLAYRDDVDDRFTTGVCIEIGKREAAQGLSMPVADMDVGEVVDALHLFTAASRDKNGQRYHLMAAIGVAFEWIRKQGMNPETIIQQKHRYNKTRPYKHGKKF